MKRTPIIIGAQNTQRKHRRSFLAFLCATPRRLPEGLNIPVLVGAGDQDELFEVEKVKELYDLVPVSKKEFLVMKNATHARIPVECWEQVVAWLDKTYL